MGNDVDPRMFPKLSLPEAPVEGAEVDTLWLSAGFVFCG